MVHLQSNRRTAVNGSLRELERPETGFGQTRLRPAQRQTVYLIANERVARACRERGWG
jgi:hypothetical protein